MSMEEHLIEQAILHLEKCGNYESFNNNSFLLEWSKKLNISMKFLWTMAQYVVYAYQPYIVEKERERLVDLYGYEVE